MAVSIEDTLQELIEDNVTEYIIQTRRNVDEARKLDDRLYYELLSKFDPELPKKCSEVIAAVRTSLLQEGISPLPPKEVLE